VRLARVFRKYFFLAALGVVMTYFTYHLLYGNRGWQSWNRLSHELHQSQGELASLEHEQALLEHTINLLDTQLDMDLLDEQVRRFLDYGHGREVVLFLTP